MSNYHSKVLILVPANTSRGGIANYYSSIRNEFPSNIIYMKRGSRNWPNESNKFVELGRILNDYFKFLNLLLFKNISIVQTTTSFSLYSIIRDGFFVIIAKLFRKKVIVFFRGWVNEFAYDISGFRLKLFKLVFFKADALIELSQSNVNHLKVLGYKREIFLETTLVDNNLIKDFNINRIVDKRYQDKTKTILFLSRIEKEKGIYKILEVFKSLKIKNENYRLVLAGDGSELHNLKDKIEKDQIPEVYLMGFVQGEEKQALFTNASVFLFLSESEGMPNAVLEAMAFGLPVIATNVGGIASVFQDNRNGVLLDNYNCIEIVNKIDHIVHNKDLYYSTSQNNYFDAKQKFWSNIVAKRMMNIFNLVNNQN